MELEYSTSLKGYIKYLWIAFLVGIISSVMPLLSISSSSNSRVVFTLYFSIIILMIAVYKLGIYGILSTIISAICLCVLTRMPIGDALINILANTLQSIAMLIFFRSKLFAKLKDNLTNEITSDKILLVILGIIYIVLTFNVETLNYCYYVFLGLEFLIFIVMSICKKRLSNLLYLLFICIIPSLCGALITYSYSSTSGFFSSSNFDNAVTWIVSNVIILLSFGYVLLHFFNRTKTIKFIDNTSYNVKFSTILFYIATLLWNALFFMMFYLDWIQNNTIIYIFPWVVGNFFFILNTLFTIESEVIDDEKAFSWFENRTVVAENNTQMLVAIIAFLLPICMTIFNTITVSIGVIFILNITSAIISIGLLWVPSKNVKLMALVKHIKTIFHLFTLSFLLLNVIMIILNTIYNF